MVFVLIFLWTIAAVLLVNNPKNESTRWVAFSAFAAGGGGLSRAMTETAIPYLHTHELITPTIENILFKLHIIGSFMNHNGLPYCFLMFAISYSGFFNKQLKNKLACVLLIPIVIMLFNTPFYPDIKNNFRILFMWCVPYLLVGMTLLIVSYAKESIQLIKRNRFYIILFTFPPIIFQIFVNYTFKAFFDFEEVWRLMPLVITLLFMTFVILISKHGLLGVKLRFDNNKRESAMRAVTSGASALNHTIKNEIGKIDILSDRIKYEAERENPKPIVKDIDTIMDSTSHMLSMVDRIQKHSQEIILIPDYHKVCEIIESSIEMSLPYLEKKNIDVVMHVKTHVKMYCDSVHMQEVLRNLIKNAAEAMEHNGQLRISAYETRKSIVIEIQDNGPGIDQEDLTRIFHPYFTTKNRSKNFGLGLAYCMNVMHKHDGKIDVQSKKGLGTTFILQIPITEQPV